MRLKLRLERLVGNLDLLVDADASTTVGALAHRISFVGDDGAHRLEGQATVTVQPGREIGPETLLVDSGICSGSAIRLTAAHPRSNAPSAAEAVAVVKVVEGPDVGKEFPLAAGTSSIGRDRNCQVRLTDPMVSRYHARIHVGSSIEMIDLGSANGLLIGDEASDKVVVSGTDRVRLGDTVLTVAQLISVKGFSEPTVMAFNRSPRVELSDSDRAFTAPQPPEPQKGQRFPIVPLFMPLIMGIVLYLSTHNVASLTFIALSPLMMVANSIENRSVGKRSYEAALSQFREDLQALSEDIRNAQADEVSSRRRDHPATDECVMAAHQRLPLLWSRWSDLPRMFELRLGLGCQPSRVTIDTKIGGAHNNRLLWREMEDVLRSFAEVDGVPVVASLRESAIGVAGPRPQALGIARALVVQAVCLHSPADLSIASCASGRSAVSWEWLKWLPHCLAAQAPTGAFPLSSSQEGCAVLLADLDRLIEERMAARSDHTANAVPAVLLVIEDDAPVDRSRAVSVADRGAAVGVHVLWLSSAVSELPAACRTFVEIQIDAEASRAGFVRGGSTIEPLQVETLTEETAFSVACSLSPVTDASASDDAQGDLPRSVSLLTLSGSDLATLPEAVLDKWKQSNSILTGPYAAGSVIRRPGTLRAVVGASVAGPHVLDLRANGPHALVGGTTGSGKSELLQSWILGMAVANSPQRVTFLLVDYKGGSAFSDCVHLPHTVGLVTDLSPHLVRRALTSLKAELRHREQILHRKRAKDLLELERLSDPEAPPSLIIVVDEFAALVGEVPEFVDGVVDVAQRGRSLGLHLILATQRPAGVIKDNLRANTNLRLALRMADEGDSTDVLGSAEAAAFDPGVPGRAVSRTGPSKLIPFQSAYVGGWTSDREPLPRLEVSTFGFSPARTIEPPPSVANDVSDDLGPTDIQRIVANICEAHRAAEIDDPRIPWLNELAAVYDLARLPSPRRDDVLVFGVRDDPENQAQPTVAFYPDQDGNMAVLGTGGAGKSTFLRTLAIAAGFTVRGGPCAVYGIDFGARGLQMLDGLPHVGSIISGSDTERITRLLQMLRTTIDQRAALYSQANAGTITDYRRLTGVHDEARILVLVDGMGAMRSAFEATEHNRLLEAFIGIAADGRPVGVHVILTADRMGAMPTTLATQVQRRVVLRLADPSDYVLAGLPPDVLDAKSPPGRGLLSESEIQVAVLGGKADVVNQAKAVERFAESMREAGIGPARRIERLAEQVKLADLPTEVGGMPVVGLSGATLAAVPFEAAGTFVVAGPPLSGRSETLLTLAVSLRRWHSGVRMFYMGQTASDLPDWQGWEEKAQTDDQIMALANRLPDLLGRSGSGSSPRSVAAVFIEAVPELLGGTADFALQEMVKKLVSGGHLVIAEGETSTMSSTFPLIMAVRSGRSGLILQPEQLDGAILRAQFPRSRRSDFSAGRGLLVSRSGRCEVVQVALADGSSGGDFSPLSKGGIDPTF